MYDRAMLIGFIKKHALKLNYNKRCVTIYIKQSELTRVIKKVTPVNIF